MKSLRDLSWQVSEEEYRQDPAYSYSTLARYEREGFNKLDSLYEKIETPALTFGSAVDALITGGQQEFNDRFIIVDFPQISDTVIAVIKEIFNVFNYEYRNLVDIPDHLIIPITEELKYQTNWKPETRVKVLKEKGREYYNALYASKDKTILSNEVGNQVMECVRVLKENPATKEYFASYSPFDGIEKYYQLKFKTDFNNITFRCMADLIIVDENKKTIQPIDLKTSGHPEWEFYHSFVSWNYQIQARLYWRIINKLVKEDPDYRDYEVLDYIFIVVNKQTLTPLVWSFDKTKWEGTLYFGKDNQIEMRDPFEIADELHFYQNHECKAPLGVVIEGCNNISDWLDKQ